MQVFVTGASGHIGSALLPELLRAGHQVTGLARSDAAAARINAAGGQVGRGDLGDLDALRAAAAAADGVIHLAFDHEAMGSGDFEGAAGTDLRAIQAMGAALAGSGKPMVVTSGTLLLTVAGITGRAVTERDVAANGPRLASENTSISLAESGVRSSIVRLPPIVHSDLDHHGFAHILIAVARQTGASAYVGDGANRWPAVHTRDAARVYRLALENAAPGTRLHAVGDEGVPFRVLAEAIGRGTGVPTTSVTAEQAAGRFAFLGSLVGLDNPASSELTRKELGWEPAHPGLIEDLVISHYFDQG